MADEPAAVPAAAPAVVAAPPVPAPPAPDPLQTRMVQELKHTRPLYACRYDPAGRFLFTGAQDYLVSRWQLTDGAKLEMPGHQSWVRAIAPQATGDVLWTGDYAGLLLGWKYAGETPTVPAITVPAHKGWIRAVTTSADGTLVATAGNDRMIRVWNTADGSLNRELAGHDSHVYGLLFHPQGQRLVSVDLKGKIKDWDLASGTATREFHAAALHKYDESFKADIGGSRGLAFSADGKWLACSGITNVSNAFAGVGFPIVSLWDWDAGTQKELLKPKTETNGVAHSVHFHPAGFIVGAGGIASGAGMLWFWKTDAAVAFHEVSVPSNTRDLALSPDGLRLATASYDSTLRIFEMTAPPVAPAAVPATS